MHSYTTHSTNKNCVKFFSRNKQKHKRAKPLNIHNVVLHKGHNFSMCPLASISSKSTQLSCSHLPQMHMIHSWSVPASSSKLPKHTQHLSLSISSSALPFLAFFSAGLMMRLYCQIFFWLVLSLSYLVWIVYLAV